MSVIKVSDGGPGKHERVVVLGVGGLAAESLTPGLTVQQTCLLYL